MVAWWFTVALAAGGVAGFLIGGVGGRLVMLLLRVTTGRRANGATSDDGFVIGQFTFGDTANLLVVTTGLGGAGGLLYLFLRAGLPRRIRVPVWALAGATIGGNGLVHSDGVDFYLLEPQVLAIAFFIAIPAVGAAVSAALVERWLPVVPRSTSRWRSRALLPMALATTAAVPVAGVLGVMVIAARRSSGWALVIRVARVLVPLLLMAAMIAAAIHLVGSASTILSR